MKTRPNSVSRTTTDTVPLPRTCTIVAPAICIASIKSHATPDAAATASAQATNAKAWRSSVSRTFANDVASRHRALATSPTKTSSPNASIVAPKWIARVAASTASIARQRLRPQVCISA